MILMDYSNGILGSSIGTGLCFFGLTMSVTETQAILSLISTIIGLLLTICMFVLKVLVPFIKRCKEARKDGKITVEEIEEISKKTAQDLENFQKNDKVDSDN